MTFDLVSWSVTWLPCHHYRVCFRAAQRISGNRPPCKGTPCEWTWEQLEGKEVIPQFKPRLVRKCVCVSMILGSGLYTSLPPPSLDGPNGPPALWPNAHNPPCYYHWPRLHRQISPPGRLQLYGDKPRREIHSFRGGNPKWTTPWREWGSPWQSNGCWSWGLFQWNGGSEWDHRWLVNEW